MQKNVKNPMGWLYTACKNDFTVQSFDDFDEPKTENNADAEDIERLKQKQLKALKDELEKERG